MRKLYCTIRGGRDRSVRREGTERSVRRGGRERSVRRGGRGTGGVLGGGRGSCAAEEAVPVHYGHQMVGVEVAEVSRQLHDGGFLLLPDEGCVHLAHLEEGLAPRPLPHLFGNCQYFRNREPTPVPFLSSPSFSFSFPSSSSYFAFAFASSSSSSSFASSSSFSSSLGQYSTVS